MGSDAARAAHVSAREDALDEEAVRLIQEHAQASALRERGQGSPRPPPMGARMCDRLLFGGNGGRTGTKGEVLLGTEFSSPVGR